MTYDSGGGAYSITRQNSSLNASGSIIIATSPEAAAIGAGGVERSLHRRL